MSRRYSSEMWRWLMEGWAKEQARIEYAKGDAEGNIPFLERELDKLGYGLWYRFNEKYPVSLRLHKNHWAYRLIKVSWYRLRDDPRSVIEDLLRSIPDNEPYTEPRIVQYEEETEDVS